MPSLDVLLEDLTSGDESRAEAAASALSRVSVPPLEALEKLSESSNSEERWWAVRTLAQMENPPLNLLTRALSDPAVDVRQAAALALVGHPSQDAVPALISALDDRDEMVASLTVNALVAVGSGAVPALLAAFPQASQRGRVQLLRALAEIRDYRAIRLMMRAMEGDSAMLYYWAQVGLERLGLDMVYIKPE